VLEDLQKIGAKWLVRETAPVNLLDLIPIYHRWIQNSLLEGLLIDVADYSHVHQGPGVMIIAHDGNYGFDESGSQRGMLYYAKRPLAGAFDERLSQVLQRSLAALDLLAREPALSDRQLELPRLLHCFSNDRLLAPNDDAARQAFGAMLQPVIERIYPDGHELTWIDQDARERLCAQITPRQVTTTAELLARLQG
jgi:hypothetical protein